MLVSANLFQAREYEAANIHACWSDCSVMSSGLLVMSLLLSMQLGAPWMSACMYRSLSVRYFFTIFSLVFASFPAIVRFPCEVMNHRYCSNQ